MSTMVVLAVIAMSAIPGALNEFGGWSELRGQATGFFHTEQIQGRWWLVDPAGSVFFSLGVNCVSFEPDRIPATGRVPYAETCEAKYGSREAWADAAVKFLRELGFNTIGSWSGSYVFERGMPYTIILNIAARAGANWQYGRAADFFSPALEEAAEAVAAEVCAPRRDSQLLLGYFLDNELHWGPDWRARTTLLEEYLMLPPDAPGRQRAVAFLRERYAAPDDLAQAWGIDLAGWAELGGLTFDGTRRTTQAGKDAEDFLRLAARRYFQVCHDAIRRHDPNHLVLGCREAIAFAAEPVASSARGLVDVFSLSYYVPEPYELPLRKLHEASGLPLLISEWAFRARDSGLPNTKGAGPLV
ncbi:MAG: beta-agarase, partial [Armatimonadetes bacterium]|nr:beta-agarase [Armatimonadota bacterium]